MKGFQDWTNYETWYVNRWITINEDSREYWSREAHRFWGVSDAEGNRTRSEGACRLMAASMQVAFTLDVRSPMGVNGPALVIDVKPDDKWLMVALLDVNWGEIANAWLATCEGYEEAK